MLWSLGQDWWKDTPLKHHTRPRSPHHGSGPRESLPSATQGSGRCDWLERVRELLNSRIVNRVSFTVLCLDLYISFTLTTDVREGTGVPTWNPGANIRSLESPSWVSGGTLVHRRTGGILVKGRWLPFFSDQTLVTLVKPKPQNFYRTYFSCRCQCKVRYYYFLYVTGNLLVTLGDRGKTLDKVGCLHTVEHHDISLKRVTHSPMPSDDKVSSPLGTNYYRSNRWKSISQTPISGSGRNWTTK